MKTYTGFILTLLFLVSHQVGYSAEFIIDTGSDQKKYTRNQLNLSDLPSDVKHHALIQPNITALLDTAQQGEGSTIQFTVQGKSESLIFKKMEVPESGDVVHWIGVVEGKKNSRVRFTISKSSLIKRAVDGPLDNLISGVIVSESNTIELRPIGDDDTHLVMEYAGKSPRSLLRLTASSISEKRARWIEAKGKQRDLLEKINIRDYKIGVDGSLTVIKNLSALGLNNITVNGELDIQPVIKALAKLFPLIGSETFLFSSQQETTNHVIYEFSQDINGIRVYGHTLKFIVNKADSTLFQVGASVAVDRGYSSEPVLSSNEALQLALQFMNEEYGDKGLAFRTNLSDPRLIYNLKPKIAEGVKDLQLYWGIHVSNDYGSQFIQVYVQDEPSLVTFEQSLVAYGSARQTDFTRHFQATLSEHLKAICQTGGLFDDTAVTGSRWQGQIRRVRAVLYRRIPSHGPMPTAIDVEEALNDVATKWLASLASAGVKATRGSGKEFYEWLLKWFNPNPAVTQGDPDRLLEMAPYPGDEQLPFGYDFAEQLTLSLPRSDQSTGCWYFDDVPHAVVTVQGLRRAPEIGLLSAERHAGDHVFSLFDRFPEHTVLVMTLTIKPQDTTRNHIALVKRAAVGDTAEAAITREDAEQVEREMAQGNKLYPLSMAFYVRGEDLNALRTRINQLNALLLPNGLQPITRETDLLTLDSYIRNLPMAYDVSLEKSRRRSRLVFSKHTANLLPYYGRSRGTGHPGLVFYNRGAEPLVFDPLNPNDRKKNAHMLILGPTGAGKSALLVYLLQQMMAIHCPRLFIIEAGGSFALSGQHFKAHGLSVNQVTLNPNVDVSLPPFAGAVRLLDKRHSLQRHHTVDAYLENTLDDDDVEDTGGGRDILGEMEIGARMMITGGDEREEASMTRADRLLIRKAILLAAKTVKTKGGTQVMTEDVVAAFQVFGSDAALPEYRRNRAVEMADGMALFCSGLAGHFFNRPGKVWPEADVTILEMGILAREGYEDQLTIAYLSIMSHINDQVERHQQDDRQTLVVTDEGHIITTNPQLARYVVKITKMWRKLGAWFWIATQNLEDFPDASRKMLNMMEWWLCLVMPKEEVEQIARFKDLTDEQRNLLLSTKKEPGKYVEGVVLADKVEALFRNVPPPLSLALAMTEKHEKAERAAIMREENCSELQAAYKVAERIKQAKR